MQKQIKTSKKPTSISKHSKNNYNKRNHGTDQNTVNEKKNIKSDIQHEDSSKNNQNFTKTHQYLQYHI